MRAVAVILALLLAFPALAADGDRLSPTGRQRRGSTPLYLLCDGKAAADAGGTCTTFQLATLATALDIEVTKSTGCSSYSVVVNGQMFSGADSHSYGTLSSAGAGRLTITSPIPELISVSLTTLTGCTDFDVAIEVYSVREGI